MQPTDLHRIAVDAMTARGLLPAFPPAALAEADALRTATPEREGAVHDLRHLPWFSIDNDDTRDLDQLSFAEPLHDGAARLCVAVADVDALVKPGGAIDDHAAANTTSVYTAAGTFAMLPLALSTDLTSLNEGVERLAVVVEMTVHDDGSVTAADPYRATVLNRARLTYDAIAAWLDGRTAAPGRVAGDAVLQQQLLLHDTIARRLRGQRVQRGALQVHTSQARPVFDADGRLLDLRADEKNRAKELIADLMIAANGVTARFLAQRGYPSLRRVLREPRRWDRIVQLAAARGVTLPAAPDPVALDRFLADRRRSDPAGFADLSLAVIKMLGSGEYAAAAPGDDSAGHFGLAVNDYAHSTAPNRRFADLVTQRLVKAALRGLAPPYGVDALQRIAAHCTAQEDNANRVERQVLKAAAALLLHDRVGDDFEAIVTGASAKGTFVRIARPRVEGRVVDGFAGLDVGDALRVRLAGVDAALGHIDFVRA